MELRSVSKMDLPKELQKEFLLVGHLESPKVSQLDQWSEHHPGSELAMLLVFQKELLLVNQLGSELATLLVYQKEFLLVDQLDPLPDSQLD